MNFKLIMLALTIFTTSCKISSVSQDASLKGESGSKCTAEQRQSYISELKKLSQQTVASLSAIQSETPKPAGLGLLESDGMGNNIDFDSIQPPADASATETDKPTVPEDERPVEVDQGTKDLLAVWNDGMSAMRRGDEIAKKLQACDEAPSAGSTGVASGNAGDKLDSLMGGSADTSKPEAGGQCTCGREYVSQSNSQWLSQFCVMRQGGTKIDQNGNTTNLNDSRIYNNCYQGCRELAGKNSQCAEYTWLQARRGGSGEPAADLSTVVKTGSATTGSSSSSCVGGSCPSNSNVRSGIFNRSYYSCRNGRCGWYRR